MKQILTIATRKSLLALWQAEYIKQRLKSYHPDLTIKIQPLSTTGDKTQGPLQDSGGKGLFVKELEEAIYSGSADIAVHSMKDVPYKLPKGLIIPVICQRENHQDALITRNNLILANLCEGSKIGTGSPRRACQLLNLHPHLQIVAIRGNIQTRINKIHKKEVDGVILAAAGLIRMEITEQIQHYFTIDEMLPAAGQGALGIECLTDDKDTQDLIAPLNDRSTNLCVTSERAVCRTLKASCHSPIGVFANITNNILTCRALAGSHDGKIILKSSAKGSAILADSIGKQAALDLLKQGAHDFLAT